MPFVHKHAKRSRVTYALDASGALKASSLIVTASIAIDAKANTNDSSQTSLLARAARTYAAAAKIPNVIIETED